MIKVMHIINALSVGGAQRFMVDMVTRLDPTIFEIRVVCLFYAGTFAPQLEQAGIPVKTLGIRRVMRLNSWVRVWQEVRDFQPQIVHSHLPEAGWLGLPTARIAGVPVRIAHLQNLQPLWRRRMRWVDGLSSRFATTALACSDGVRRFFVEQIGYSDRKMRVVYNAVDLAKFDETTDSLSLRTTLAIPRDALVVACVASLKTEQKGHRFLLEAMTRVRAEVPNVVLLVVGDGAGRRPLEQEVEKLRLRKVIRFLGPRQDVPAVLGASDLFVLPSLWEGLPVALVEAGAAGLASVATRIEGVCELLQDGITGLLVEPGNSGALARALIDLLKDEKRRCDMGLKARALVEQRFDINRIAMDMQALYMQLFKSTGIATKTIQPTDA